MVSLYMFMSFRCLKLEKGCVNVNKEPMFVNIL